MLKIKKLRIEKGFTQEELANACGVKRNTISMIELGVNLPSLELSIKLAKALKCTIEDLVGDVE